MRQCDPLLCLGTSLGLELSLLVVTQGHLSSLMKLELGKAESLSSRKFFMFVYGLLASTQPFVLPVSIYHRVHMGEALISSN